MNYYVNFLELLAFVISLLAFRIKQPVFYLLCFILFFTVVNEWFVVQDFPLRRLLTHNEIYNFFSLADMAVWFGIFYLILRGNTLQFTVFIAALLAFAFTAWELFALKSWNEFHTDSMRVYSLFIIYFASLYFYSRLKLDYYNFLTDPIFWLCAACFLFHSSLFISFTAMARPEYFKLVNAEHFFFILHNAGNTFYYVLLSVASLLCYCKQHKTGLR